MKLFGFDIRYNASWRLNLWAIISLMVAVGGVSYSTVTSDFFASYRLGDSIIPREDQLIRTGPYVMDTTKIRNGTLINFHMVMGTDTYSEKALNFNNHNHVLPLVGMMNNLPVAYLWLYADNPVRKLWKIEINNETVLSYDHALFEYHVNSNSEFFVLKISLISFVLFLFSICTFTRPSRGSTDKLR